MGEEKRRYDYGSVADYRENEEMKLLRSMNFRREVRRDDMRWEEADGEMGR